MNNYTNTIFPSVELDKKYFEEKLFEALKIPKKFIIDSEPRYSSSAIAMKQTGVSLHEFQKAIVSTFSNSKTTFPHFNLRPHFSTTTDLDPEGSRIENKSW